MVNQMSEDSDRSMSAANSDQEDLESVQAQVEEDVTPMKKELKRSMSTISSTFSGTSRKRNRISVYETAAHTTADGMMSLGESIKDAQLLPQQTRFDQCIEVLNEMKVRGDISSKEYFGIVRVFMDKEQYPALFYGMTADLRMEWLAEEGLLFEVLA